MQYPVILYRKRKKNAYNFCFDDKKNYSLKPFELETVDTDDDEDDVQNE